MEWKNIKILNSNKFLIRDLEKLPGIEQTHKSIKCFPGLGSYITPKSTKSPNQANQILSPNFINKDTHNSGKSSFSFKNVFKRIEVSSNSPNHLNRSFKSIASQNRSFTNTLNYNTAKNLQPDFKSVVKVKSKRKSFRFLKLQPIFKTYDTKNNPQGLRINRLSCVSHQDRGKSENVGKKMNFTPDIMQNNNVEDKDYQDSLRVNFDLISEYLK